MCGIVGYTGSRPVTDILMEGLSRLEYRGYDSAGIAVEQDGKLEVVHCKGKVSGLAALVAPLGLTGTCGIGHTRWATHGRPSEANAHPHVSCDGHVAVVHNGIIENYAELREELEGRGHAFTSETDTEVIAHLVEEAYGGDHDLLQAVREATERLIGAYALAVVSDREPGTIVAARKDSPLVVGLAEDGAYVASDIIAMIDATRDVAVLADGDMAKLTPDGTMFFNVRGEAYEPEPTHVDWDLDVAEKGGYPDFMMKEIHEQPRVIRDTLAGRLVNGALSIDELDLTHEELNLIDRVYVIACGTSYHAGLIAKNLIEGWARIPCEVEVASEFRYRNPIITPSTLVVAVSQSGETADTLAAVRDARVKGAKVFGITNVVGSPLARESDGVIYTKANKEIAVASTKSFLGQVVSLTLLALLLAQSKGKLKTNQVRLLFHELADTAEQVERILADASAIDAVAEACKDAKSALFVGRGMGAAIALRGRAQAQGDQLPARRGLSGRRDEARPHRAHRRGLPRHRHRHAEPGVRQDGVEPAGSEGARGHGGGHRHRGRRGHPRACRPRRLHPEGARRAFGHHGQRAAAAVCARHRRGTGVRRGPAAQPGEIA